jgi:hypothetical protein
MKNNVFNKDKIELLNFNGDYISKPVALDIGQYYLTEFLLLDSSNNILYAAPKEESSTSYLVNKPLPLEFLINKDEVTKLVPEVLEVEDHAPSDFGYSTFSFKIVETLDFLLSVFIYDYDINNYKLTDASLTIKNNSSVIYSDSIYPYTNSVSVNKNYDSYEIIITKDGFRTYSSVFPADSLEKYDKQGYGPLIITLDKDNRPTHNIYGLLWQNTTFKIATIDYKNESIEYSPVIRGLEALSIGSSAYDPVDKKFIVVGRSNMNMSETSYLKIIDPQTGVVEKNIEIEKYLGELEFELN